MKRLLPLLVFPVALAAGCVSSGPGSADAAAAVPASRPASFFSAGVVPPIQIGAETSDVSGVRLGLPCVSHRDVEGLDLALFSAKAAGSFSGVQVSGVCNGVGGGVRGVQAALLSNRAGGTAQGLQLALCYDAAESLEGLQVGALCYAASVDGAQIGLINGADSVRGVQIGVFNATRVLRGVQIGLSNYVQESGLPWFPIVNARF